VLPLIELLREGIFAPPFMHMDESYLQVLKSEKAPTSTHYMVVRAAGPPGKRIVLYDYIPSGTREALNNCWSGPRVHTVASCSPVDFDVVRAWCQYRSHP
jgi:hypothetical protein